MTNNRSILKIDKKRQILIVNPVPAAAIEKTPKKQINSSQGRIGLLWYQPQHFKRKDRLAEKFCPEVPNFCHFHCRCPTCFCYPALLQAE